MASMGLSHEIDIVTRILSHEIFKGMESMGVSNKIEVDNLLEIVS